jgi:hypothetical protein
MIMEKSLEIDIRIEKPAQGHFVHHKSHVDWNGGEAGWEAGD